MCDPLLAKYQNSLAVFNPKQYSYVQFVESPIETFFSPRPFQYVFCLNVVNHVKELDRTIDRLYELTEPGGCLILSTDCHNFRLLRRIFQLLQFDILHPHQFTADEYLKIFQNGRKLELVNRAVHKRQMIFSYTSFVFKKADPEKTGDAT
jgi:2-polyprenyl-3-methyl-5-hydroxy-6-metoxy-1,4-benzoquinol methylase